MALTGGGRAAGGRKQTPADWVNRVDNYLCVDGGDLGGREVDYGGHIEEIHRRYVPLQLFP